MSANLRETRFCIGFHRQSALHTPLLAADCVSLLKTNPALFAVDLRTENDAAWIGKNDEFATTNYLTAWDAAGPIEGFLTSEKAALFAAFGLGKAVLTPITGGGVNYVCTPLDPVAEEIEMPATTIVETIRQGAAEVIDRAMVGMACEEFGFEFNSGPGLQAARCTSQWVGSGLVITPGLIVVPPVTPEHLLRTFGMEFTMLTTDYITSKTVQSASFRWRNNLRMDTGFFPGSGSSGGAQIRGRMEHGDRECTFSAVARFQNGSPELGYMLNQQEGTMELKVSGAVLVAGSPPLLHDMKITLHRVVYRSAVIGDADGIVTVAIETLPMTHSVNGLVTIEINTSLDEVLVAA